jgi:F-box-like
MEWSRGGMSGNQCKTEKKMKNKNLRPALAPPVCCHYHPDFRTFYSIFAQYTLMVDVTLLSDESPSCSIPTISPQTLSASRFLPPDILIHIFTYLPIAATRNVALCSRRFKVLVYDDEIWDAKLRLLGLDTPITLSTEQNEVQGRVAYQGRF